MKQVEVDKIITYLNTVSGITAITWSRIYFWLPISDEQAGIYITINIIWEQQAFLNKGTLLEVRFIANDTDVTFKSLMDLRKLVSDELLSSKKFGSFNTYNCYEVWNTNNWYDSKNRKVVIQDYRFYFLT